MFNLTNLKNLVAEKFPALGVNKKREIIRLIYEISKRENFSVLEIFEDIKGCGFKEAKQKLLSKRYPKTCNKVPVSSFYLPELNINPERKANLRNKKYYPKNIYIEKSVLNSDLSKRVQTKFSKSEFKTISSLKNSRSNIPFNYNKRTDNLFIVKQSYDFIKPCPCTKNVYKCGYNILNLGFGCSFECSYCFLQNYQNVCGIILPANIDDYFKNLNPDKLHKGIFKRPRIGTGEFTDSLVFDDITGYSIEIIKQMQNFPNIDFEFKTKSTNIENILRSKPSKNIVISWSVNPPEIIKKTEFFTPGLKERLTCAQKCVTAGFNVGFHFDPMIYTKNWQSDYKKTVDEIFNTIDTKHIKWISIGSFRFEPELKKVIENRFPENTILGEELILDFDNKLRYFKDLRIEMYKALIKEIKRHSKSPIVYLCMEPFDIWQECGLSEYKLPKSILHKIKSCHSASFSIPVNE